MDSMIELSLMQDMTDAQRMMFQSQMNAARKTPSTAVLLALFTGGLGGQYFYLGRTLAGVMCVLFCWTFIPAFIAVIHLFTISGTVRKMNEEKAREIAAQIKLLGAPRPAVAAA